MGFHSQPIYTSAFHRALNIMEVTMSLLRVSLGSRDKVVKAIAKFKADQLLAKAAMVQTLGKVKVQRRAK